MLEEISPGVTVAGYLQSVANTVTLAPEAYASPFNDANFNYSTAANSCAAWTLCSDNRVCQ
jgi:hypothetical protein